MGGSSSESRARTRDVMLGLCFTLFGIAMGQQLALISSPPFDWTFGGGQVLGLVASTQRLDLWNFLEFWYFAATIIFIGSSVLFLAFFTLVYFRGEPANTSRLPSLLGAILFLTLGGFFPYVALHMGRLFLTYVPHVDPEYCRQVIFLGGPGCTSPEILNRPEWTFQATRIPPEALAVAPYSIGVIGAYLVAMVILWIEYTRFRRHAKGLSPEPAPANQVTDSGSGNLSAHDLVWRADFGPTPKNQRSTSHFK